MDLTGSGTGKPDILAMPPLSATAPTCLRLVDVGWGSGPIGGTAYTLQYTEKAGK